MKAGHGKRKGSQFERKISEELSLWWTHGKNDNVFWRTQGSGARATTRSKKGRKTTGHYGDLCAIDEIGKPLLSLFTFELKTGYGSVSCLDLIEKEDAKNNEFAKWISNLRETQKAAGSISYALIHQRMRRQAMIFFPIDAETCPLADLLPFGVLIPTNSSFLSETLIGVPLRLFFDKVSTKVIKEVVCLYYRGKKGKTS